MIPKHVAIIPDGNRRWARGKGREPSEGHAQAGRQENLSALFRKARDLGVKFVSIWVFSTENWKRSAAEKNALFNLLRDRIDGFRKEAMDEQVRVRWFGRRDRVPDDLRSVLEQIEKETEEFSSFNVQFCLDYGGRDELLRAINKAIERGEPVDDDSFTELLDSKGVPDPDLIIRTSGEQRLSGFLPWQGIYAELLFVKKHFPDFTPDDLAAAIASFDSRKRRFGGNS